jgi:hypothetical protein
VIYRVEFFKDGSVVCCDEVESQLKEGGYVCFVEAPNKADAIARAKTEHAAWSKRLRENRFARGQCKGCKSPRIEGRIYCQNCTDKHYQDKTELRRIKLLPNAKELLEERARLVHERRQEARLKAQEAAQVMARSLADQRWDAKKILANKSDRSLMRQVLRRYDMDPVNFRAWVLQMLGEFQEAQAAE